MTPLERLHEQALASAHHEPVLAQWLPGAAEVAERARLIITAGLLDGDAEAAIIPTETALWLIENLAALTSDLADLADRFAVVAEDARRRMPG